MAVSQKATEMGLLHIKAPKVRSQKRSIKKLLQKHKSKAVAFVTARITAPATAPATLQDGIAGPPPR
jgi:hypothetical protein